MAANIGDAEGELPVNITPIIDIIFCLVLFFMASYAPRSQKAELSTYLPKDVGNSPTTMPLEQLVEKENISIYIVYDKTSNKYLYGVGSPDEKEMKTVVNIVANMVRDKNVDNVPPIRLSPAKNVGWEAITQLMSELKHASPKIKEIQLSSPQ